MKPKNLWNSFETTKEIKIPKNPLERVIGQDEAVRIAAIVAKQRRHLLLFGPPGTGKSMIAEAIASLLPPTTEEISVLQNPRNAMRPLLEVRKRGQIKKPKKEEEVGRIVEIHEVPFFVAEALRYRCERCGTISPPIVSACPSCGAQKHPPWIASEDPYAKLGRKKGRIVAYKVDHTTGEQKNQKIYYERHDNTHIKVLTEEEVKKEAESKAGEKRNIIVPLSRLQFVQLTGATEAELLGDVAHDPYGGHPDIGIEPYKRVIPGAVHEAHEGLLYIDEISTLGPLQRYLLTAMQNKNYPIVGKGPTSTGAAVRVDGVPCDFILVGATNINDISQIIPPLRSRIRGDGYEVLVNSWMPDTEENRAKFAQFVAQEIQKDKKIPHMSRKAVEELLSYAISLAKSIDNASGITLRLRLVGGPLRLAGDLAKMEGSELIEPNHLQKALKSARSVEEQIIERYGSEWNANIADYSIKKQKHSDTM